MYNLFRLDRGSTVTPETYLQFIVPEERAKLEKQVIERIKHGLASFDEQITFIISGEQKIIQIKATPILDAEGKVVQMVGIDMDISQKRTAEEKERENEFMKALLQKKDEFMSIASHELKTPITTTKASLQVLTRLIEKHEENNVLLLFAKKASQQINKVTWLISDLMDNAKIQAGKMDLNIALFSFQDVIDDCISFQTGKHKIIIEDNVKNLIEGDKMRVEQVLTNFVNNAIKYSPEGSEVIIKANETDNEVKIEVTDFGIGIPEEKINHVFDRFFRVEDKSQQSSGLGLGLYISSEIIKRHGGKYGVISEFGKGSTFWFTLPLKQSAY
jgi:two-component system CheB/CheR fusion protein